MIVTKINMDAAAVVGQSAAGKPPKEKHDRETQNIFRRVVKKVNDRGMVVNNKKNQCTVCL